LTIKVAVHRICDRCAHPFSESNCNYGDPLPSFDEWSIAAVSHAGAKDSGKDTVLFHFEDLCPDCDRVVEGYIKKIRLDAEEPPRKKKKGELLAEIAPEEEPILAAEAGALLAESPLSQVTPPAEATGTAQAEDTRPY
jgi:hypothetical protein